MRGRIAALGCLASLVLLVNVQITAAEASSSTCPGPAAASSSRCVNQSPSVYDKLRQRLGGDLAKALAEQQKLSTAVDEASASAQLLSDELTSEEARIADLQDKVAQLDQQIADLQARIAVEREQISTLARAMYRQPNSFLDILASSGSLSDALTRTADLIVAGQRAHVLQKRLQSDLVTVQADRDARQTDLDRENAALAEVQAGFDQLAGVQANLDDLTAQLSDLISRIQDASTGINGQPADVTAQLAQLLEQEEQDLIQQSDAAAWAQANAGAGLALVMGALPVGSGPSGLRFSWPMPGAVITQPFGPTSFVLEPRFGGYPHFHTGVDLAAPLGKPILAAANGIVVAVGHSNVGYGNYVIIAHGSGVMTLYGHLLTTFVKVGQHVARTEPIGREGSTGFSTGPHLHFEVRINGQVVNPLRYLPPE
jgi:murein DD-endopeptidase MepM/ murein hydrolase activator NlpD